MSALLRDFRQHDPPQFGGEPDPSAADLWRTEVEKIFDTMQCTSEYRVPLAIFLLQGEARHWWSSVSRMVEPDFMWTLEEFVVCFNKKFFPEHIHEQRALEFETIVQGEMTMSQYEAQHVALYCFTSYLVDNEKRKAYRFVSGLRPILHNRSVGHLLTIFDEVVHQPLVYEEDWALSQRTKEQCSTRDQKSKAPSSSSSQHQH
ncbi:uncharacterized protein LOC131247023 [Magnolia sinica]|uniref:uncharacterized protein LOC131247023 n=1 Tax=Magnolia sinica TaxID=86752 RepID=UPI002658C468|nr:uncharacterized protein LOC131247023 [Magnolia sinica]